MMRLTVLASGSRGNSAVIASRSTRILLDAGLSCRELFKRMQQAGEDPAALDAIVISHEHQDHVQGLAVAARRLGIPVYFTETTHRAWQRWMRPQKRMSYAGWLLARQQQAAGRALIGGGIGAATGLAAGRISLAAAAVLDPEAEIETARPTELEAHIVNDPDVAGEITGRPAPGPETHPEANRPASHDSSYRERELAECVAEQAEAESEADAPASAPCALPEVRYFAAGIGFTIGDIAIEPFTTPHDAADPCGFLFASEGRRIGVATDLGYMPASVRRHLSGCDLLMLESNHDLEMLRDGPYPWSVKQRVLSRVGHLSNAAAAEFLERDYDGRAAYIVLAHLSESNNLPELARVAAEYALREHGSLLGNRLVVAGQHEPTPSLCV